MKLLHSCRKAAELLSQRMDEPIGWLDTLRLRLHLSMCGNCAQVQRQFEDLRSLSGELEAGEAAAPPAGEDAAPARRTRHAGPRRAGPPRTRAQPLSCRRRATRRVCSRVHVPSPRP